jgi:hypothetical protein
MPKKKKVAKQKSSDIKFPDIEVKLVGNDGNAFYILGTVKAALQKGGAPQEDIDAFWAKATSGDYDNLLATCMEYVTVL